MAGVSTNGDGTTFVGTWRLHYRRPRRRSSSAVFSPRIPMRRDVYIENDSGGFSMVAADAVDAIIEDAREDDFR
jgi:hypothetical protein